jgi:mannosyltransferase
MQLQVHQESDHVLRDRHLAPEMSAHAPERRQGFVAAVLLVCLTVLALVLRFWRLGNWSLDSDEVFMLRDSLNPSLGNPRPLLYFLNHYLVGPLVPLDEFGLRVLPAIFGVLAIPAFYLVARRLVGTRAALFGALLLTVNPLHVYYSQFARYWSLVFLLSAVYPYALYIGLREHNRRALALGLVTGVLASLAHPCSVILVGGLGVWILATYLTRDQLAHLWGQKSVRWGTLVAVILTGAIAVRFIPMLNGWLYHRTSSSAFLFHLPNGRGMREISYLLSFAESTTVPLVLTAIAGIYLLWQMRDRSLAVLLVSLFTFQLVFLTLVRLRAPISTFYLVPSLPVLFIGAGVFLDRPAAMEWKLRPAWLFSATVAGMMLAAGAPTLVSQYLDGRRWDFRAVARWLDGPLAAGDIVFSDQSSVMAHYLPEANVRRLVADPVLLEQAVRMLHQSRPEGALWIVAPAPSHAFRTNRNLGSLNRWMYSYCQLRNSVGVGRVDFRQQYLEVFRCPRG